MKNVAIINVTEFSSTGKIAVGFHQYLLDKGYNSYLCYCRGNEPKNNTYIKFGKSIERYIHAFLTRITGRQGCYSYFATKRLLRKLDKLNIDTIYGENLHGYYINEKLLFKYIAKKGIKYVYIVIDEYPYLGKCWNSNGCERYLEGCGKCPQKHIYPQSYLFDGSRHIFKNKMKLYPLMKDCVFAGPEFVMTNAKKSPLMRGIRTEIVDEGINIDFYSPKSTEELRKELGFQDDKIVLFSTANLSDHKGGNFFFELAKRLENDTRFIFIHAGNKVKPQDMPSNYIFVGFVAEDLLPVYFSLADLFIFPSFQDCMPNACLEALACGTPLVCFNISGMPYIAGSDIEYLVKPKDIDDLERVVLEKAQKKSQELIERCRQYAVNRYDRNIYYRNLERIAK